MTTDSDELSDEWLDGSQEEVAVPCYKTPDGRDMYEHHHIVVDAGQQSVRIDRFLAERLRDTSRNRIQMAAEAGCILVAGRPVRSNYKVRPLDEISIVMDRPRNEFAIIPRDIPLDIVYEDAYLLVVNKPAGMVVHPGHGNYDGTLVNALAWHLRNEPGYDPADPRMGLVHRIDKDTSGLLVVAKTPQAKTDLGLQFFNKTTRRRYNALVWGRPDPASGTIVGNIGRSVRDRLRMDVFPPDSEMGKHAVTHYSTLMSYGPLTLVECVLETGRTHQIRAHMRHIGHPLFNDERYGGNVILRGEQGAAWRKFVEHCFALCSRQALHARTLGFRHPATGEEMDFECPLPPDMTQLLERLDVYFGARKEA